MVKNVTPAAIGILLGREPNVYATALPGRWLLEHSTPSWRIRDPHRGFQRIVKERRAKEIARTVLDVGRAFPNAITLATDVEEFGIGSDCALRLPARIKFLVVDGQHRLWAQQYSKVEGKYPCVIHTGQSEQGMARLFLEINDNQRRVPSSLRWDLYRLVRPGDKSKVMAADIVYELATRRDSPFYSVGTEPVAIDLTGEDQSLTIRQGSLAPEIKSIVSKHTKKFGDDLEDYLGLLIRYFTAIKSLDPGGWGRPRSTFFQARVLRALLRVLSDLIVQEGDVDSLTTSKLREQLARVNTATLAPDNVRRVQGSAGVHDLYMQMRGQIVIRKDPAL